LCGNSADKEKTMFTYIAFYRGKQMEVKAMRSFDAQEIAAKAFKARKSYEVTIMLAARPDGTEVIHTATWTIGLFPHREGQSRGHHSKSKNTNNTNATNYKTRFFKQGENMDTENIDTQEIAASLNRLSAMLMDGNLNGDDTLRIITAIDTLATMLARWHYIR